MHTFSLLPAMTLASVLAAQGPDHSTQGPDVPRSQAPRPIPQGRDEALQPAATGLTTPPAGLENAAVTPIHTQAADPVGGEYGTWAAGAKYKVSFHGEMTFVPYLGTDYPQNQPWSWRTTAVRRGATELLAGGETARREHDAQQYRYRYENVTEVYDVRSEGLEQSFVIERPIGGGDLVIEGQLTTALVGEAVTNLHQPIGFHDANGDLVMTYGEAIVFDASGRRADVTSTLAEGRLSLRVDGAWLEQATFPVTVDPILTPTLLTWGTLRQSFDICRDDTANDRGYAFIRAASTTDNDAYFYIAQDDFSGQTQVWNDVTTSWSHQQIRVAAADSPTKYLVVFDRFFPGSSQSAIRVHQHDSGDLVLSTAVDFGPWTSTIQDWRADVGGTLLSSFGDTMLVTYQRDTGSTLANTSNSDIWAFTVDITGISPVFGAPFELAATTSTTDVDLERPAVNKQAAAPPTGTTWMVVWQEYNNTISGDDWDTAGRLVDSAGAASTAAWFTYHAANGTHHQLGPVVAGSSGRYCVGYALGDMSLINFKTAVINGTSVNSERLNWSSLSSSPAKFAERTLWGPHTDRRWRVGGIGYDQETASHWAITSLSDTVYSGTGNVYIDRVGYSGAGLEYATLYSAVTGFNGDPGGVVFDDDSNTMVAIWAQNDTSASSTTAGSAHEIYGTSFEYPTATAVSLTGTTCSSLVLNWNGTRDQQIGHEFPYASFSGAPASSVHFLGVSLVPANVIVVGPSIAPGCRLLISDTSGFLGWFPIILGASGTASLSLPEWLPSLTLYFQDWYLDPSVNQIFSSQRLVVPIVK